MTNINPFKIFNLECKFKIEQMHIMLQFAQLQKEHHPDSNTTNHSKSLDITHAFEILKNEIKRGEAILAIHNVSLDAIQIPQEFLTQLIECETHEAQELFEEQKEQLLSFEVINQNNVALFAIEFLKYKYLKSKLF